MHHPTSNALHVEESSFLRVAKKGQYTGNQFYGCSNYPKCKYLQNINTITV